MSSAIEEQRVKILKQLQAKCQEDGTLKSNIPALSFYTARKTTEVSAVVYEPSFCMIFQGAKALFVKDETLIYDTSHYLLTSVHMPIKARVIDATKEEPYISLKIAFSLDDIFEVLKEIEAQGIDKSYFDTKNYGFYVGEINEHIMNLASKLIDLEEDAKASKFLINITIKEILYYVLQGPGGDYLREYVLNDDRNYTITKVITKIKEDFSETLNMAELAKMYKISESFLYHNFKKITSMSPIQFQKTIRLSEARKMLMLQNMKVNDVAFEVGYDSPSQFSREYSRMYGASPKKHAEQQRLDYGYAS